MKRDKSIDILKGLAICLVVLGHVISSVYDSQNYNQNLIFKICYSFHMPLFIFIGGWLDGLKGIKNLDIHWLKKKTLRLLVPYIIWTCFKWIITNPETGIIDSIFVKPLYWYLINAYFCTLVVFIAGRFKKFYFATGFVYALITVTYMLTGDNNLVIKNMVMFFPFYLLGFYIVINKEQLKKRNMFKYLLNGSVFLYPLSMIFYSYKQYDVYVSYIKNFLHIQTGSKIIKAVLLFYNHYIVALLGICFVWVLVSCIVKYELFKIFQKVMSFLGLYTMQIYLLHDLFFVNYFSSRSLNSIISFVFSIGIVLVISVLVAKCKKINKILFGC